MTTEEMAPPWLIVSWQIEGAKKNETASVIASSAILLQPISGHGRLAHPEEG
jgi:hypothetical protein